MEFSQLEAFLEAANRGSFRRAAEALYLSQPSVSARVQALEDDVGVTLFHRTARGVRLTDMGLTFLPFAQRSMETLRRGREVMESVRQASAGILNIATARVIGTYVLPETLQQFHQLYPETNLHIKVGGSTDVLQMVVDEEVQLGLARFMQHPDVDALHLYDEEAVLVVHPSHPFAQAGVAVMFEVAQEPLILYDPGDPGSSYYQFINRVCRDAGVTRVVYASSNHAVGMHELDDPYSRIRVGDYEGLDPDNIPQIDHTVQIRPDGQYGISKAFGEATGAYYAENFGLEVACLRIGTVNRADRPVEVRQLATWCSHRDVLQLIHLCLEVESLQFDIFYGVSDNKWRFWDIDHAREVLGYAPEDNGEDYRDSL